VLVQVRAFQNQCNAQRLAIPAVLVDIGGVRSPVPIQLLRVLLGLLAMFFAYALGRAATRLHNAGQPIARAFTWLLRTVVSLGAILWTRGFDLVGIAMIALSAATLGAGVYVESRPHHSDRIHLFPEN
jgi:hypothetical protein